MAKARIPIPNAKDPLGVLTLAADVVKALETKGEDAQIVGELAKELVSAGPRVAAALKAHAEAKELERQLEKLYEQRDAAATEALPLVQRASKALQGNLGAARLREMGDYGYTVDDSPRPPRAAKGSRGAAS